MATTNNVKTLIVEADYTWSTSRTGGTSWSKSSSDLTIPVSSISGEPEVISYAAFEFNVSAAVQSAINLHLISFVPLVVELEFYFKNANNPPVGKLEFLTVGTPLSNISYAKDAFDIIHDENSYYNLFSREIISGESKSIFKATLGSTEEDYVSQYIINAITLEQPITICLRRPTDLSGDGSIDVGGNGLLSGTYTDWRLADGYVTKDTATELAAYPRLIITYDQFFRGRVPLQMRYTTSDPTTAQNTPANSIGGYLSSNVTFSRSVLSAGLGFDQNTLGVVDLPTKTSGLAQVGPEVIRYAGIDSDNSELTSITRGIVPKPFEFPTSLDNDPEYVSYLDPSKLFDRNPTKTLVQYRCVALINPGDDITDVSVSLLQNPDSNVQIDIGIEVPLFDVHNATTSASISAGSRVIRSTSAALRNRGSGFFNNAYLVLDYNLTAVSMIVTSYEDSGSYAEFIVDRDLSAYSSGTVFRIYPAKSQTIINDETAPTGSRFFGFLGDGGSNLINYHSLRENGNTMKTNDVFYLWVKKTHSDNSKSDSDSGAIIMISYQEP